MKRFLLLLFIVAGSANLLWGQKKMGKLSADEKAKLTPEQRITYDNDRAHQKAGKKKKQESTAQKVRRAKREDRSSRRIKRPKK